LPHGWIFKLGEETGQSEVTASPGRLDPGVRASAEAFIGANTRALAPPLVPEILLHLAEESLPIWQKTEEELGETNVPPPYWAFAWAGGQALARYVLDHPALLAGKRVLDLGSGSGLTAIAAMKAGAAAVLASDIDRMALAAVHLNAALNGVVVSTTAEDLLARPPAPYGVVLVGDLFYERGLAELVTRFIEQAAAQGALVLIGDPQRNYFPKGRFTAAAEYRVPVTRELEDAEIKRTCVWRLG
jgi:predicted nicotinamide N-methyase